MARERCADPPLPGQRPLLGNPGGYAALIVEGQVSWLPAACPLRKECYTLSRDAEGSVVVAAQPNRGCRLSTAAASTSISLW